MLSVFEYLFDRSMIELGWMGFALLCFALLRDTEGWLDGWVSASACFDTCLSFTAGLDHTRPPLVFFGEPI